MWISIKGLALNLDDYSNIRVEYGGLFDRWQIVAYEHLNGFDETLLSFITEQEADAAFELLRKAIREAGNVHCCSRDAS